METLMVTIKKEKQYMVIPKAMKKLLRIYGKVPLNDDEIIELIDVDCPPDRAICGDTKGIIKFARAVEKAHGIGEKE